MIYNGIFLKCCLIVPQESGIFKKAATLRAQISCDQRFNHVSICPSTESFVKYPLKDTYTVNTNVVLCRWQQVYACYACHTWNADPGLMNKTKKQTKEHLEGK